MARSVGDLPSTATTASSRWANRPAPCVRVATTGMVAARSSGKLCGHVDKFHDARFRNWFAVFDHSANV
jgi:hypothetical protein